MVAPRNWEDILGHALPSELPPVPRNSTPVVDQPECPQDCSGRHGMDSEIRCVSCQTPAYQDWWHEYRVNRGVNFHQVQAVNGAPVLVKSDMPCPVCGGVFSK